MVKKHRDAKGQALSCGGDAREARRQHVTEQYGRPLFSCDYSLDPYIVNEMSRLIGVRNDKAWINVLAFFLTALLVIMLVLDRSLVVFGVVMVVIIVAIMSAGERINRIKTSYLKRHGYDTTSMTDDELRREVYLTDTDAVVECPGTSLVAYPVADVSYVRSTPEYLLASFGHARYVIFPRKEFSLSAYHELTRTLEARVPHRWYSRFLK